jgi:hypothetical protein
MTKPTADAEVRAALAEAIEALQDGTPIVRRTRRAIRRETHPIGFGSGTQMVQLDLLANVCTGRSRRRRSIYHPPIR